MCYCCATSHRKPVSLSLHLTSRKMKFYSRLQLSWCTFPPTQTHSVFFTFHVSPPQSASQPRLSYSEMTEDYPRFPDIHDLDLALLNPRMIVVRPS